MNFHIHRTLIITSRLSFGIRVLLQEVGAEIEFIDLNGLLVAMEVSKKRERKITAKLTQALAMGIPKKRENNVTVKLVERMGIPKDGNDEIMKEKLTEAVALEIPKDGNDEMKEKLVEAIALWNRSMISQTGAEENKWRKKAKVLEEKCSVVTKQLKELRGAIVLDHLPLLAPCKCHFFKSAENELLTAAHNEGRINFDDYIAQSSVQIFLRNVRLLRKLKLQRIDDSSDEVRGDLAMVIGFVIELLSSQTRSIHLKGRYGEAYVHHAVDFIKDTIPLLREGMHEEQHLVVNNLVTKLVLDLVGKLLNFTPSFQDSAKEGEVYDQERILVVMLRLAEYAYIGHRLLLISSQQMAMVLERLQCMNPFDEGFSQVYENLFFMFQLVETLVAAHMLSWRKENNLGQGILEEWVTCHFQCKTTLERRPAAWTFQFMILLDHITEKLLEQLQTSAGFDVHDEQDIWQKALVHLLASASSALRGIQQH